MENKQLEMSIGNSQYYSIAELPWASSLTVFSLIIYPMLGGKTSSIVL